MFYEYKGGFSNEAEDILYVADLKKWQSSSRIEPK